MSSPASYTAFVTEVVPLVRSRSRVPRLDEKTLGKRLRTLRLRQGLTQADLAAKLGIKQPMLSLYEQGDVRLPAVLLVSFTAALGVSSDEILGAHETHSNGHLEDRALVRRLMKVSKLSRRDRQTLLRTIDRFLKGSGAS